MNTRIASSVLIAALSTGTPASAQTAAPASLASQYLDRANGLSLEQAIARAIEQEPALRGERTRIDVAQGMQVQASLRPNPSVSFERREEPGGTDNLTAVTVQWPLDLFRRSGRVAVANGDVAAARLAVADRERMLAADVRMRYGDVLAAVRELTLFDELVAAVQRQHDLLRARAEQGAAPPLERDLLEVELRRLQAERVLQAGRVEAAMFELKRLLGVSAAAQVTLRDTLEEVVQRESSVAPPIGDGAAAVEQRADVREAAALVNVADAKIRRAEGQGRFDVSVYAAYMRMNSAFPQQAFAPDGRLERIGAQFNYLSAGAMVTIPVLNRNQGEVAAARAERTGAAAAHDAARLAAETEVASARVRDEHARQAVRIFGSGAQALARQNLAVVGQSFELGRVTVFDVLAEQRRYLEVERAYTEALRAAYEARTALNRALGEMR
jgi:cobalt-zinc-cadmium efflux system outer membrane protein